MRLSETIDIAVEKMHNRFIDNDDKAILPIETEILKNQFLLPHSEYLCITKDCTNKWMALPWDLHWNRVWSISF